MAEQEICIMEVQPTNPLCDAYQNGLMFPTPCWIYVSKVYMAGGWRKSICFGECLAFLSQETEQSTNMIWWEGYSFHLTSCGTSVPYSCQSRSRQCLPATVRGQLERSQLEDWQWFWSCCKKSHEWWVLDTDELGCWPQLHSASCFPGTESVSQEEAEWQWWGTHCSQTWNTRKNHTSVSAVVTAPPNWWQNDKENVAGTF